MNFPSVRWIVVYLEVIFEENLIKPKKTKSNLLHFMISFTFFL